MPQARLAGSDCEALVNVSGSITPVPPGPTPPRDLSFPEVPRTPAAGGPGAADPGTRGDGTFTQSDAVDSVVISPPVTAATPIIVNATAGTEVATDTQVRPADFDSAIPRFLSNWKFPLLLLASVTSLSFVTVSMIVLMAIVSIDLVVVVLYDACRRMHAYACWAGSLAGRDGG